MRRQPCGACPIKQTEIERLHREVAVLQERLRHTSFSSPDHRPVAVSTHGGSWKGRFHTFVECHSNNTDQREMFALVEDSNGDVSKVDLTYHSLKFLDR